MRPRDHESALDPSTNGNPVGIPRVAVIVLIINDDDNVLGFSF